MDITQRHPDYDAFAPLWQRVRDALAGGDAVKARATAYLPRPEGQDAAAYGAYKARARWVDVPERTRRGLLGAVFRREPVVAGPARLLAGLDGLATKGLPFRVFVQQVAGEVLALGRTGILVDMPGDRPAGALPLWAGYAAERIEDWDRERIDGRFVTARVKLAEPGTTASEAETQYRELLLVDGLYEVRIWRTGGARDGKWRVAEVHRPTRNGRRLDVIPFVFLGVDDLDPDVEKPPLLGLVDETIGHYQLSADYRQSLFLTAQPTPWLTGFAEEEMPSRIGSGALWASSNPEARVGMLEFQGAGIEAIRQAMLDSEARMVLLGARFFERQKRAAETAEATRLRFSADGATLTTIAQTLGDGLAKALRWTAEWAGLDSSAVSLALNKDFLPEALSADDLRARLQLWQSGAIAFDDLVAELKRGEVVDADRSAAEIQAEREGEPSTPQ
ncbi:MAG: DUF4055 domain-containing protein [Rhodospirillales bacterium]|nr:DUF4055 domain-containing protein [Rhodospirillales bacterium]MDH3914320.1 DUF4055 domain-containing protein [Rhodospirillales bacterium]